MEVSADLELEDKIVAYRAARNWALWDNAKDVAIAIAVEAARLLEVYQWREPEEVLANAESAEELKDELADVIIYGYVLAQSLNLNVDELIDRKLEKNNLKYPVKKSRDNKEKYNDL
ncbi:MazG-like family protein [Fundicoccus ignavus]|uniref:MazG-like family protein n=1 Tax=Fundicoccus ignavus TaxID=2664442 RepID=UPI001FE26807|nr:MazG-like family protein [Fundicoccus ignavus]